MEWTQEIMKEIFCKYLCSTTKKSYFALKEEEKSNGHFFWAQLVGKEIIN